MLIRHLKIIFVAFIALLCLIYATQNVVNLEACYQAFAYVLGGVDHQVYTKSIIPPISSPAVIWLVLFTVVGLEFLAGLVATRGAWDLWRTRKATAEVFNGAKTMALVGCGLGIIVWQGLFAVFGGALFQMWQTEIGGGSLNDAFKFFGACALTFLIVRAADD